MSQQNPYEKFLDGRPLEFILATTPDAIAEYLDAIGAQRTNVPPAPGKWSAAEIVSHLADCEIVFAFRMRQTLAEDNPRFSPSIRTNGRCSTRAFRLHWRSKRLARCASGTCGSFAP
jgi:hypothetical protein